LDASLGFETNREENHGAAMNDSLTFFAPFVNKYASMADMIALGTVMAVGACSGPLIPFKGGRVDATQGGDTGVPDEFGTIEDFLAKFSRTGFNQTEMIQLVACGHTLGSVHQAGFPDVVQNAETPNNTNGGVNFDDTVDVYDNHVAIAYVDGTTKNPLVTSFNASVRSDLVVFNSDNNATIKKLAASNNYYFDACTTVMSKMLNTVPKGVSLGPITPIALKPVNVQLDVNAQGQVTFSGAIRLLSSKGFPQNSQRRVIITYKFRDGSACTAAIEAKFNPATTQGSSLFGDTYYHLFSKVIDASGISSYTVSVYESSSARTPTTSQTFTFQDTVAWLPGFSNVSAVGDQVLGTISAAVYSKSKVTQVKALLATPVDQLGAKNPRVSTIPITLTAQRTLGSSGYTLYSSLASTVLPIKNMTTALRSTVDIQATVGGKTFVDDFRKLDVLSG